MHNKIEVITKATLNLEETPVKDNSFDNYYIDVPKSTLNRIKLQKYHPTTDIKIEEHLYSQLDETVLLLGIF